VLSATFLPFEPRRSYLFAALAYWCAAWKNTFKLPPERRNSVCQDVGAADKPPVVFPVPVEPTDDVMATFGVSKTHA